MAFAQEMWDVVVCASEIEVLLLAFQCVLMCIVMWLIGSSQ